MPQNFYTKTEADKKVDDRIQQVVGAAPEALDTLEEIADRLKDDNDAITAINGVLEGKVNNTVFEEYKDTVFTKTQVDSLFNDFTTNVNNNFNEIRNKVNAKANSDDVYTKTEIGATVDDLVNTFDTKLDNKANTTDIKTTIESLDDVYVCPGNIFDLYINSTVDDIIKALGTYTTFKQALDNKKLIMVKTKQYNVSNYSFHPISVIFANNTIVITTTAYDDVILNHTRVNAIKEISIPIKNNNYATKLTVNTINISSIDNLVDNYRLNVKDKVYTKTQTDKFLTAKANVTEIPTKVSQLERDDIYYIHGMNDLVFNGNYLTVEQMNNIFGSVDDVKDAIRKNKIFINKYEYDNSNKAINTNIIMNINGSNENIILTIFTKTGSRDIYLKYNNNNWTEIETTKYESYTTNEITNMLNNFYTKSQTDTNINNAIQNLIGTAPEALDTLGEIAEKLNDNDDAAAVITNQITELNTKVNNKVKNYIIGNFNNLNNTCSHDEIKNIFGEPDELLNALNDNNCNIILYDKYNNDVTIENINCYLREFGNGYIITFDSYSISSKKLYCDTIEISLNNNIYVVDYVSSYKCPYGEIIPTKISQLENDNTYTIIGDIITPITNNDSAGILSSIGNINSLKQAIINKKQILYEYSSKYYPVPIIANIHKLYNPEYIELCIIISNTIYYARIIPSTNNAIGDYISIHKPIDNLVTASSELPLSANQGFILKNKITELSNKIAPISNIYQFEDFIPLINDQINTLSNDVIYSLVQAVYKQYLIITSLNNSSSIIIISCNFNDNTFTNLSNGDVSYTGLLFADCIINDETYHVTIPVNNNQLGDTIEVYKHFEGIRSKFYSLEEQINNNGGSGL